MLSSFFTPTAVAAWITFLVALFLLNRRTRPWPLFIPLLFFLILAPCFSSFVGSLSKGNYRPLPINLALIVSDTFLIWIFSHAKSLEHIKRPLTLVAWIFAIAATINLLFFQGPWQVNTYSRILGDVILSLLCFYFFFAQLTGEDYTDLLSLDYFWLAAGLLFYSMGSEILNIYPEELKQYYKATQIDIGFEINFALHAILYAAMILAFFCRWKTTTPEPAN